MQTGDKKERDIFLYILRVSSLTRSFDAQALPSSYYHVLLPDTLGTSRYDFQYEIEYVYKFLDPIRFLRIINYSKNSHIRT